MPARTDELIEVNIDRVVGPTHHFGGLGVGNLASLSHAGRVANPRAAAIQGIEKMRLCAKLGGYQLVLPPQRRPNLRLLRQLGFQGPAEEMLRRAQAEAPDVLSAAWSDSAMWTANAATVSPACDCVDGRAHLTVANLTSSLHRSIEPPQTLLQLRRLLSPAEVMIHRPLPPAAAFRDEGAANHMRLCDRSGRLGIHIFVYGDDPLGMDCGDDPGGRFPARQTRQAFEAIARRHRLRPDDTFFIRQHPKAIAAGAFHNDVVATSCQNMLLHHQLAFTGAQRQLEAIKERFVSLTGGQRLWRYEVDTADLSLEEAVDCYLFNSQLIPDANDPRQITLVCPIQVARSPRAARIVDSLIADAGPIAAVQYVDLTQSMSNGGGPACLRLRIAMTKQQWSQLPLQVRLGDALADDLIEIIEKSYPESMLPGDLADADRMAAALAASSAIRQRLT
jgi:succinylarginine dihydrolase